MCVRQGSGRSLETLHATAIATGRVSFEKFRDQSFVRTDTASKMPTHDTISLLAATPFQLMPRRIDALLEATEMSARQAALLRDHVMKPTLSPDAVTSQLTILSTYDPSRYTREPEGAALIMVYPEYGPKKKGDANKAAYEEMVAMCVAPSETFNDLLVSHESILGGAHMKANTSKATAYNLIRVNAPIYDFVHIAMCGHGTPGALVMADKKPLALADVVNSLKASGFKGHALITLNACYADADLVRASGETSMSPIDAPDWKSISQFEWTFIASSEGSQKRTNADHFARMLAVVEPVIRENVEEPSDWPTVVKMAWNMTVDEDESPGDWVPCPTVTSSKMKDVRAEPPPAPPVVVDASNETFTIAELRAIFDEAFGPKAMADLALARQARIPTPLEKRMRARVADAKKH